MVSNRIIVDHRYVVDVTPVGQLIRRLHKAAGERTEGRGGAGISSDVLRQALHLGQKLHRRLVMHVHSEKTRIAGLRAGRCAAKSGRIVSAAAEPVIEIVKESRRAKIADVVRRTAERRVVRPAVAGDVPGLVAFRIGRASARRVRVRRAGAIAAGVRRVTGQHVTSQLRVIALPWKEGLIDRIDPKDASAGLFLKRVAQLNNGGCIRSGEKIIEIEVEARVARNIADEALAPWTSPANHAVVVVTRKAGGRRDECEMRGIGDRNRPEVRIVVRSRCQR